MKTLLSRLFIQKKKIRIIILFFSLIFLFASLILWGLSYYYKNNIITKYKYILETKTQTQINIINKFLNNQKDIIEELAHDPMILEYAENNNNNNKFNEHIKKKQDKLDFENILIFNNNSQIIYSIKNIYNNINIADEMYIHTPVRRSFLVSFMTLTPDFSDYGISTIANEPVFYVTAPLIKDNKFVGVISIEIHEEKVNALSANYLGLEKSGEIVVAVQTATEAFFIMPTRLDPTIQFTRIPLFGDNENSDIQRAARGERGTGIIKDYLSNDVLASWAFIPRVDWGIVVKINTSEILAPVQKYKNFAKYSLFIALFLIAVFGFFSRDIIFNILSNKYPLIFTKIYNLKVLLFILLCISIYLLSINIIHFDNERTGALKFHQKKARDQTQEAINKIRKDLNKITALGDFIAHDLKTERLVSDDIKRRLRREVIETEGIASITIAYAPYEHDSKRRLFAPSITQLTDGSLREQMIEDLYDYSNKEEGPLKTEWFTKAFETQKPQWLNPRPELQSEENVVIYARPFFLSDKKKASGVVAIAYKLSTIANIARNISVGATGFSYIISDDGTFLYHPLRQNIIYKKTLLQFAQEYGDEELVHIAFEMQEKKPLLRHYYNKATQSDSWLYTHPIEPSGWTIATLFKDTEIGLTPDRIRENIFDIIFYTMITLLILLALLCCQANLSFRYYINFSNIIFLIIIISLWIAIYNTPQGNSENNIIVTDQSGVQKFINERNADAYRRNMALPIAITSGIEIYSLEQTSPKQITFSGFIWHRYHKVAHKDVLRVLRIPQAINFTVQRELKIQEGEWEIIGMDVNVTLYQEHDYSYYPFDSRHFVISLEHADSTKNTVIIPDVDAYFSLNPKDLPGINTTFNEAKTAIKKTYFDFIPYAADSDLGSRSEARRIEQYRLDFNILMKDDILGPFIFFFLPLLVILISIFAVLILEERRTDPYTMIGPYTGLFFALVLLHRSLHESAPATQILYIEYAFFYVYITIIILVIHTVLLKFHREELFYQNTIIILKHLFWPLQLAAWILTTLIIF